MPHELLVPTSDPRDSYRAFDMAPPLDPYGMFGGEYAPYVARVAIPGPVSIQPATITHAPWVGHNNPEFYMSADQPRQGLVAAQGAPPIPFADPGYVYYQIQVLTGNGTYEELIGAYAPRVSDGSGVGVGAGC